MTGFDAQRYDYTKEKAIANGMELTTNGDSFVLSGKKALYGHFENLTEVFQYLCGYETGKSEGKFGD